MYYLSARTKFSDARSYSIDNVENSCRNIVCLLEKCYSELIFYLFRQRLEVLEVTLQEYNKTGYSGYLCL